VLLLGIGPFTLSLWQKLTLAEITFHHSNLRLPVSIERLLVRLIVTPRSTSPSPKCASMRSSHGAQTCLVEALSVW
jgi:hypothetical protein